MREMTGDRGLPAYIGAERVQNRLVPGLAIAIVLTLVTAMVGAVAVRGASSGSSSPKDAVRQLIDAGIHADVLGVLDVLDPAERDVLVGPVQDTVAELKRLQVLNGDIDLHHISGIAASIEALQLTSHEVGDGVTDVTIGGGRLKSTVDPAALPLGTALRSFVTTLQGARPGGAAAATSSSSDLGGRDISTVYRTPYRQFLVTNVASGRTGAADLCAYFFLRAVALLATECSLPYQDGW